MQATTTDPVPVPVPVRPYRRARRSVPGALVSASLAAATVAVLAAGCGGGGNAKSAPAGSAAGGQSQAPSGAAGASGSPAVAGVTRLGAESGAARLAAARAVPPAATVTVPLTADGQAPLAKWPDACSLLTPAQVKAVVPGNYTPKPVSSTSDVLPDNGVGKLAHGDECQWQLGGGPNGSYITVDLTGQNPASVQNSFSPSDGPVSDEGDGIKCQDFLGDLQCVHQSWDYTVRGLVLHADTSSDNNSPPLVSDWLTPVAVLVGSVLQGS